MKEAEIVERLEAMGDPARARVSQVFFKTGPGQYGEGDLFVGLTVPQVRALAKEVQALSQAEIIRLLHSPLHEARLLALFLLIRAFAKGDETARERIFTLYLQNARYINNWDLVDCSAEHIVGAHLWTRGRSVLDTLAESSLLWERRICILATFHFIKRGAFGDTLRLAERLVADRAGLVATDELRLQQLGQEFDLARESAEVAHAQLEELEALVPTLDEARSTQQQQVNTEAARQADVSARLGATGGTLTKVSTMAAKIAQTDWPR